MTTCPSDLYVIARFKIKDSECPDIPDAYLQVWGPFAQWVPGIRQHCRFSYEDCYRHYVRCTTPGDTMYLYGP